MPARENKNQDQKGVRIEPEKELFSWTAPARPFKRRNKEFYISLIVIAGVVGLVLFLAEGFMPVILIISLIFLYYVLSTVEPEKIGYEITNRGVKIGTSRTDWDFFLRFWFGKRFDSELLIFETLKIPGRMELVINGEDKQKLRETLSSYIPEEEIPPSRLDRLASWFSQKLPQ